MSLEQAVEWYAELASVPGWKAYVWHRVQEMALEFPMVYAELPERLTTVMKERAA